MVVRDVGGEPDDAIALVALNVCDAKDSAVGSTAEMLAIAPDQWVTMPPPLFGQCVLESEVIAFSAFVTTIDRPPRVYS